MEVVGSRRVAAGLATPVLFPNMEQQSSFLLGSLVIYSADAISIIMS